MRGGAVERVVCRLVGFAVSRQKDGGQKELLGYGIPTGSIARILSMKQEIGRREHDTEFCAA